MLPVQRAEKSYPSRDEWFFRAVIPIRRSHLPRGLRRGSAADRWLGLRVRIPPVHGVLSVDCCVLSGRGLCDGPITRPGESYRV
jgi:hypothetical protein